MDDFTGGPGGQPPGCSAFMDDLGQDLQSRVDAEALAHYGPEAFRRWKALPTMRRIPEAQAVGRVTGSCGDTIEISLVLDAETIISGAFFSDGCGASQVCASVAVELAVGKCVDAAYDITGADILAVLEVFPDEERHCAYLAAEALNEALHGYMRRPRS